ncbi:molecular chaperone DnaK [Glaciihabitans sp. INWT7]|uniref:TraR/DksA family transcriptional regulator n=1 Tax=Glaciihabitans sp. INWT7 TaxID=2596912 RepID=UPI001629086A|nr:TraR/DksA C4-type zinc finger protein [Glaciihabitans sp. INWT7]QNE46655.1 molecular chaperone DnaK [Glaciihabitans sp. INWT7]
MPDPVSPRPVSADPKSPDPNSPADRLQIESVLAAERAELERGIDSTRSELDGVRVARADASADDEHDPEGSTLSSDWSRIEGIGSGLRARLEENDAAHARLAAGTYGACVRCGRPIGDARLEARPSAALCIECAREMQR